MKSLNSAMIGVIFSAALTASLGHAAADTVSKSGTFSGASNHVTRGSVAVVKTASGGMSVVMGTDFSLDGAPDPIVGFGKNGKYAGSSKLGKLNKNKGAQTYVVPHTVDTAKYNEVYVWCEKYNVPLGVALLK